MTRYASRPPLASVLALVALVAVHGGCERASPTEPTPGQGPTIAEIAPSQLKASQTPQAIVVRGDQFRAGLALQVRQPDSSTVAISGDRVQNLTNSSFQTSHTFALPGTYALSVQNANGDRSPEVTVRVDPSDASTAGPTLTAISPGGLVQSALPQLVTITGENLAPDMVALVLDPVLQQTSIGVEGISNVSATSFQLAIVANRRGTYLISVRNSSGQVSNTVALIVS